jgi:hypothetical protein
LENKHKLTPVHFAAYLGRHKFLELFLRKIENIEPSKLQMFKNRFPGKSEKDQQKKIYLMELLHNDSFSSK